MEFVISQASSSLGRHIHWPLAPVSQTLNQDASYIPNPPTSMRPVGEVSV